MTSVSPTGSPSKRSIASRFAPSTSFKTFRVSFEPPRQVVRLVYPDFAQRDALDLRDHGFAVPVVASGNLWTPHRPREWDLGRKQP